MTDKERIQQLEEENQKLKDKLSLLEGPAKVARIDPVTPERVKADFELPDDCRPQDISKLKQLIYMLVFPETTYAECRSSAMRIRLAYMSDAQYEFYCKLIEEIYKELLAARQYARDNNLNVWDLNCPNITRRIAIELVGGKRFKHPYIHKGESTPRKGK